MGPRGTSKSAARRKPSLKTEHNSERGRYSRATSKRADSLTIAIDATIRAVAAAGRSTNATISAESLRYKQFKRRAGSLYVLVVDTSGSMAARRIERAREIAISLLRRAYIHRDSVAIVVFRGATAEEVLPPSRSILRAKRALESLEIGGGTPLSAGVLRALELVKRASTTHGEPVLLLFTDGGANVPLSPAPVSDRSKRATLIAEELAKLGSELRSEKIASVVISTGNRFTNDARAIAEQLGAQYFG